MALSSTELRERLKMVSKCVCDGARLMVGQGDYAVYEAHMRRTHPTMAPMTQTEFFRHRENARFGVGSGNGFRCC